MKYVFTWTDNSTQRINFVSFPKGISDKQLRMGRCRKNDITEFDNRSYGYHDIWNPGWILVGMG